MRRNHLILAVTALAIVGALAVRARHKSERVAAHVPTTVEEPQTSALITDSDAGEPRLVELGADKCASCKAMVPVLAELREAHAGELEVDFIDVWKFPDQAEPFQVRVIPTQVFLAPDGSELARHEGFYAADAIRERWASLGFPLEADPE